MRHLHTKRFLLFALALLLCGTVMLASCGSEETSSDAASEPETSAGDVVYRVTVKDLLDVPYQSDIAVQFMQNGERIAMQPLDENGTAEKVLSAGTYDIVLAFADNEQNYHYEQNVVLTAQEPAINLIVSRKVVSEPRELIAQGNSYDAYPIETGCFYTKLTKNSRNYFLFAPTVAGKYEFKIVQGTDVQIGYYGAPHFVLENNTADVKDNTFTISVSASMIGSGDGGTSVYVIGVDAMGEADHCILGIERIGDPDRTIEDEPWIIYEATEEPVEYDLPEGAQIKEFDLTAATDAYPLVFNEEDGFYHLNTADGPLVLVRLSEDCEYIACFETILDRSGVARYFYNEDGSFDRKESYDACLLDYIACTDLDEGVYPLTKDLEYIIKNRGEYVGWWDIESASYLFVDLNGNPEEGINHELAWLLMCCYIE
ncbi:MAG: hypothetical protein IJD82_08860 [Clostridia bacterium]|nr:hypothetical protein [Clostridia bacterium]